MTIASPKFYSLSFLFSLIVTSLRKAKEAIIFCILLSMADKTLIRLRDYQQEIVARVHQEWSQHRSVMVQMPTGTGKTYVLAEVVESFRSTGVQEFGSADDIRSAECRSDASLRSAS